MAVRYITFSDVALPRRPVLSAPWGATLRDLARMVSQIAAFWAISAGGSWLTSHLHLMVPGNVIGMCALFAGLTSGVIKSDWLELGGGFLTKHLAFFFIPVTVGVMGFGSTFARAGTGIVVVLVVSTILGFAVAGIVTERLSARR